MKNFKRYILGSLVLVVAAATGFAQQVPLYSQYYFNKFIYNPALTGHSGNFEGNVFGRNQYTQIDGYQTAGLSLSGQVSDGRVGIGGYLINDANLLQTQNSFYGNYAYNIMLSDANVLSFGLGIGVISNRFNTENFIATDPNDEVLRLLATRPGATMDASIGANIKISDFQFGISVPQFLGSSQEFSDNQQTSLLYDLQNHVMIMTSYDLWVSDDLMIQPLFMYKNTKNAPGQFDINVIADWKSKGWLGAAYRDGYGVTAMAGIKIGDRIRFGYSYDWSTGDYSQALGGSHEILAGIYLNSKRSDKNEEDKLESMKQAVAKKHNDDLKEQDDKIKALEEKLADMESKGNRVDTVYVVQKTEKPAKTSGTSDREARPGTEEKPGRTIGDQEGSGEFIVVAGSFGEEANATIYFNQLVNKGFSPYMYYHPDNKTYYVHLGKYYFKEDARKFAKENTKNGVKLWVKTLK